VADDSEDNEPLYPHVGAWVEQWLASNVERRIDTNETGRGVLWCPRWWDHPEVRGRLFALWRDWEAAFAVDDLADWWEAFDRHWNTLTAEDGPFGNCKPGEHRPYPPLQTLPMPAEALALLPDHPGA
jgi:hypothetical protein